MKLFELFLFPALSIFTILFSIEENHPPAVKIISPKSNSAFPLNSAIRYAISVSDKEDGDSKFSEIAANEVFLEVVYYSDSVKINAELKKPVVNDAPGLAIIKTSNCFNCHGFNTKIIGPSFYEISKRYAGNNANIDIVAKRIRDGSAGVWGAVGMPTHPEISEAQSKEIVKWILDKGALPNVNYYSGTEGSFRIKSPESAPGKSYFLLTASYTDHGIKEVANSKLKGEDKIIITSK
ncbi:MAG: c-type cytochrome [Flavitalea sp.]